MKYNAKIWKIVDAVLKSLEINHIVLIHKKLDDTMFAYNIFTHKPIAMNKLWQEIKKLL